MRREIGLAAQSEAAGRSLGSELAGVDLRSVFLQSDGLQANGTLLTQGIKAIGRPWRVGQRRPWLATNDRLDKTWIMAKGELADQRVCALGLYGDALQVGYGCEGGGRPD